MLDNNKRAYSKQENYYVSLSRKTKKNYYANLNEKDLNVNSFSKPRKHYFQIKTNRPEKNALVEERETAIKNCNIEDEIVNHVEITEILNKFFQM